MNNVLKGETMRLEDMVTIIGGTSGCVTNEKVNGVITGFCAVGSFFNNIVGVGCAGYAVYQYYAC